MERIVVVGAGLAGLQTATALRQKGFAGSIVMIGAEPDPPYDRPPLSKRMLLDAEPYDSTLPFDVERLRIDLRLSVRATGLRSGVVETDAGDLAYDGLVIATGSEPIELPGSAGPGPAGPSVRYLRTRREARTLRDLIRGVDGSVPRLVIVGAGWIGAEVATAAARAGCAVTVLERAATPVAHAVPPEVGAAMAGWYARAGVDLRTNTAVEAVEPDGVTLVGGERVAGDLTLVAIGVRPATGWLESSGPALDVSGSGGVVTGPDLAASWPNVVAAGDVAARWSPRYAARIRGEHWDDALRGPAAAVETLLAGKGFYDPVPYVWSEQFDRMVQYAGHPGPEAGDRLVWRGEPDGMGGLGLEAERGGVPGESAARLAAEGRVDAWSVFWLDGQRRIRAVLAVDDPRAFVQGRKLAESGVPVDPDRLGNPAVPVKQSVAGSAP